jgi:hypothetical protein
MSYPTEICQLVIRNMEIVEEAPNVVEVVENKLFAAVNELIKRRVAELENWKGCYEFYTGTDDETSFAPKSWPETEDGVYGVYFTLYYTDKGEEQLLLSTATGLRGAALCLRFEVNSDWSGLANKDYKQRMRRFYAGTPELKNAGFFLAPDEKNIYLPFHCLAEQVAEEYPNFEDALKPLDKALADLFRVCPVFDNFVKKLCEER